MTLADLVHVPNAYVIDQYLGLDCLRTRPNLARWWERISSLPSWKKVLQIAEEDTTGMRLPPRESVNFGSIPHEIRSE